MTRPHSRRARPRTIVLAASLACGGLGLGAGAAVAAPCPATAEGAVAAPCATPSPAPGGQLDPTEVTRPLAGAPITRTRVLTRAADWVDQGVPYSQRRWWTDRNGTYRQDCSGYVAMSWHLDENVNYWTGNLSAVSYRIASSALRRGDVLLLPRHHVVIFAGWAGDGRFNLYEEYGSGHPARYVVEASLTYYLDQGYGAYRYENILDGLAIGGARAEPAAAVRALGQSLRPVLWTRELAEDHEVQAAPPEPVDASASTPPAAPEEAVEELIRAQRAADRANLGALPETAAGSAAPYVVVAGLGLAFLAYPLRAAARAGVWSPRRG